MFNRYSFTTEFDSIKSRLSKILSESFDFQFTLEMQHYLNVCKYTNGPIDKQLETDIKNLLSSEPKYIYNGQLLAACCLQKNLRSNSTTTHVTYILSSYILLLFQMGAGINCHLSNYLEGLGGIRPQLFIGSSFGFQREQHGLNNHITESKDMIRLFKKGILTLNDLNHLQLQASSALESNWSFIPEVKNELMKVASLAHFLSNFWMKLTKQQQSAFSKHNAELVVFLLQASHQFFNSVSLPKDALYSILDKIVELNHSEIDDLSEKLIDYHCESFPEAKNRIKM